MKGKIRKLAKKKSFKTVMILMVLMLCSTSFAFASEPTTGLNIEFDFDQMFTWANQLITAMLPVVYITMGISLAFLIIRSLKMAFS
ncbi:hypothetical protein [Sporosalibacterium faouarense]|uniref:hypothetical protein n=1 Tax=Sporosalibacterium faouarense TaxID=516123 RepID=UPI00192CC97E|nr:hypothetical protein [Sporosalibacterium faouarense]